jgi:hypothetical protein
MIPKPRSVKVTDRRTTIFYNEDGSMREYCVRGGVCFPTLVVTPAGQKIIGYVVVLAQNVDTKRVDIIDEVEFLSLDNVHGLPEPGAGQGHVIIWGVTMFLNDMWSKYGCKYYYWSQDADLMMRWRIEISKSIQILPKPSMIRVLWGDDKQAMGNVWQMFESGMLYGTKGTRMSNVITQIKGRTTLDVFSPELHSLQCAVNGLLRFPMVGVKEE